MLFYSTWKRIFFFCLILISILLPAGCFGTTPHQGNAPSTPEQTTITLKGKDLSGAQFNAVNEQGKPLTFQIKEVELDPQDQDKETYLYTVFYLNANRQWENLCTPDRNHLAKAIPFAGTWDKTGNYHAANNLITFGCTSGAIGKCVRLGYKPWKTVQGKPLRDFHQACVRMIRADYCGNGKEHTQDGTPIHIYDVLGIQQPDPANTMPFEAAWAAEGATFVNRARWFDTPAQLLQECPERLKGHINLGNQPMTAAQVKQTFPSSLIFNDSQVRHKS